MENINEQVKDLLCEVDDETLLDAWNKYCERECIEGTIHKMYEINDAFYNSSVEEIMHNLSTCNFDIDDSYYVETSSDFRSYNYPIDFIEESSAIDNFVDWIVENKFELGCDEIAALYNDNSLELWQGYLSFIILETARVWDNPQEHFTFHSFESWKENYKEIE